MAEKRTQIQMSSTVALSLHGGIRSRVSAPGTNRQPNAIAIIRTFSPYIVGYTRDHFDYISVEYIRHALDTVEGNKPAQRILATIAYKNGLAQIELAERYGTGRRTIYSWLMGFDTDEPFEEALSMIN